jgi:hypothetical protein
MMKISISALTMALLIRRSDAECSGDITLGSDCSLAALEAALAEQGGQCNTTQLFGEGVDAATAVEELCEYDAHKQFVELQGTFQHDRRYFDGGGKIKDGENSFAIDFANLQRFITNGMEKTIIDWPNYAQKETYNDNNGYGKNGYITNFNIDPDAEKGSCKLNTAMCCYTESVKDNFVDNTDVCRHDLSTSPQSNHIKAGWSVFSGDEPAHCVGFTWKAGDASDIYKGNALFYSSLYQTATNGYMGNVPGAPMCACVEQMPVVTKADCVTATGSDLTYKFSIDAATGEVSASHTVTVTYGDCGGNDLSAQVKELHADSTIAKDIDDYLVDGRNETCDDTNEAYLHDDQLLVQRADNPFKNLDGEEYGGIAWKQLFGKGIYFLPPDIDSEAADKEMRADLDACVAAGEGRQCLILRICTSCDQKTHQVIVYKRLTPFYPFQKGPSTETTIDIPALFQNYWKKNNNVMGADYNLYSSVDDALNDSNPWEQSDYNSNNKMYGFPRNSGPHGYVGNQWNSYDYSHGHANHHAFYIEVPSGTSTKA